MNKLSMAVHQAVSFSSPMMHCSRSTAVFWPGCALMKLEPHIISHIMTILRRAEPGIGLAAACCGQPTHYLQPQRLAVPREFLPGPLVPGVLPVALRANVDRLAARVCRLCHVLFLLVCPAGFSACR